jgi:hypothetical protein
LARRRIFSDQVLSSGRDQGVVGHLRSAGADLQPIGLAQQAQDPAGGDDLAVGQGGQLAGDPVGLLVGEGHGLGQAARGRRQGHHLGLGPVDPQRDPPRPAVDLQPHRAAAHVQPVTVGVALRAEEVHVP